MPSNRKRKRSPSVRLVRTKDEGVSSETFGSLKGVRFERGTWDQEDFKRVTKADRRRFANQIEADLERLVDEGWELQRLLDRHLKCIKSVDFWPVRENKIRPVWLEYLPLKWDGYVTVRLVKMSESSNRL